MLAWGFGFGMWRLTLACFVLFLLSAEHSAVLCGAWPGTFVTWPWLRLSMTYCCAVRLWSQICVMCRRYRFQDTVTQSCCAGARCPGTTYEIVTTYVRDCYGAFRQHKCECGCCEMLVFRVFGVWQNLYVFSLYRNPDLDDRIFDCCRLRIFVPLSSLWVIWMTIIRSGWVLPPRTAMELQLLTSQLSPVAISWLSAEAMHVVEHLTSWWLMSLT